MHEQANFDTCARIRGSFFRKRVFSRRSWLDESSHCGECTWLCDETVAQPILSLLIGVPGVLASHRFMGTNGLPFHPGGTV